MGPTFSDHFSKQSAGYSKFRLQYPPALFQYLADLPGARELAWDCATGSGQAAQGLTLYFDQIIATDISQAQLAHAAANEKINYEVLSHWGAPATKREIRWTLNLLAGKMDIS